MNFEEFTEALAKYAPEKILFVGLGNELRGDDAAGLIMLDRFRQRPAYRTSHFINAGSNPENYLQKILNADADLIVFIDAARFSAVPGTIAVLDSEKILESNFSTHAFSIKLVEQFLRQQKEYDFVYIGIEPNSTGLGHELSLPIRESIDRFFNGD